MKAINQAMMKYQLTNLFKAAMMYYGIMILVIIGLEGVFTVAIGDGTSVSASVNNMGINTVIFLFVLGLNILKQDLKFFSANSLTRKQLFGNVMLSGLVITVFTTLMDIGIGFLYSQFVTYVSFGDSVYPLLYGTTNHFIAGLLVWSINLFAFSTGFVISNLYYKLNKIGKTLVSVLVPASLFIIFPYVDAKYFEYGLITKIYQGLLRILGISPTVSPYYGIMTFVVAAGLLSAASYGFMRRAILKD